MTAFAAHMQALAQEFIGTVLFVDDQIGETPEPVNKMEDNSTSASSAEDNPLDNAVSDAEIMQTPNDTNPAVVEKKSPDDSHVLKIRRLSSAFSANDILCSPIYTDPILVEEQQTEFVNKVCRLANKADVIVLDWQMEAAVGPVEMGTTARKIIDRYKSDNPDRDILVCIFTAESEDKVNADQLSQDNVKVFYVWKKETDSYEGLPQKIFHQFAERHEGLLPSAALSAIKVIRDNTHRIISRYSSSNDAAYLSHRCSIHKPDDAEIFATEIIAATISDLIRGNEYVTNKLRMEVLLHWLEAKQEQVGNIDFSLREPTFTKEIDVATRVAWLSNGLLPWLKGLLCVPGTVNADELEEAIDKWDKASAKCLVSYFTNGIDEKTAFAKEAEFAKLTLHAMSDVTTPNMAHFLTLGTIFKKSNSEFYLCIQPLCDSVRLKPKNQFLFLKLEKQGTKKDLDDRKGFNVVVNDGNDIFLKIDDKISKLQVFTFIPSAGTDRVLVNNGITINAKSSDDKDVSLTYLAQLRQEHARRIATSFLHKITRVGLDESEWLRRHGTA